MRRIVVIQVEGEPRTCKGYALQLLIDRWQARGIEVVIASSLEDLPDADLAFLHVNLSVVPPRYAEAALRYPRSVNARASDIRKRLVSRSLVTRDDAWDGPVIVKSDLNCLGIPEYIARARTIGETQAQEEAGELWSYKVFAHKGDVPEARWLDPSVVVERFLPEQDERGHYLRTWIFLGRRESCRRFLARKSIIKGADYLAFVHCEVPEFLRAERERLGLDYGKFDFVMHRGQPILLDANKTMGIPPANRTPLRRAYSALAPGVAHFLAPAAV